MYTQDCHASQPQSALVSCIDCCMITGTHASNESLQLIFCMLATQLQVQAEIVRKHWHLLRAVQLAVVCLRFVRSNGMALLKLQGPAVQEPAFDNMSMI